MSTIHFTIAFLLGSLHCGFTIAQHCPPIVESYLSEISVKHKEGAIAIRVEYTKNGGQPKKKYQAYVVAYLEKNRKDVPAAAPKAVLDSKVALILHSQLIERDSKGRYGLKLELDHNELAKKIIDHRKLTEDDRTNYGGWGQYNDKIRIAMFIPFLEDKAYSNMEGLPDDKHECNYKRERALLFQELPYALSIHFGIVQAVKLEKSKFHIQINGDKPAKAQR